MGFRVENNCVGCERCINCGQRHEEVHYCDGCGDYSDMWNPLYEYEGQELCIDCIEQKLTSKICDDMDDERCAGCKAEADTLYQYDGDWLCEECLLSRLEKVDTEC